MREAAGNPIIEDVLRRLVARINDLRAQSMSHGGRARLSPHEMRAIVRAIAKGDSQAGRQAAVTHVKNASAAAKVVFGTRRAG